MWFFLGVGRPPTGCTLCADTAAVRAGRWAKGTDRVAAPRGGDGNRGGSPGSGAGWAGRWGEEAVSNVNGELAPQIVGLDDSEQEYIDQLMIEADGTPNKSNIGANATLSISLAVARAAAKSSALPLYRYLGGASASTHAAIASMLQDREMSPTAAREPSASSWWAKRSESQSVPGSNTTGRFTNGTSRPDRQVRCSRPRHDSNQRPARP